MTVPKEEKCEACCGSGYINFWTDDGHISMRTCRRCDGYGYIKAKPMTNEEWIKSLDTEQLAKRLHNNDVYAFFVCRNGGKVPSEESYVEWLKEKHHAE